MSKQGLLVKNTIIIALGKLSTQFLTLLMIPLYTNFLSVVEFGTVDLIMTYAGIVVPVMAISIERAVFRHLIDARKDRLEQGRIITNSLHIYGIGLVVLTIIFAILQMYIRIPFGWLVYVVIVAVSLSNFFMQVARGFGDTMKYSVASAAAGVITVVSSATSIVYMGWGAEGMLVSIVLANLFVAGYLFIALHIGNHLKLHLNDASLKKELLGYSAPLVPSSAAWWVINAADRTIITIVLGVASNGIYAAAYRFPQIFSSLFSFFNLSWQESASMHVNSKDRDSFYSQTMNASIKMFGALGACVIAGTGLFFEVLIGNAFHDARQYVPVLVMAVFFSTMLEIYSGIYIAKKMTKQVFKTSLAAAIINVTLTLLTIRWLGLYAPAIGMGVAYLSMTIMRHYDLRKYVHIRYKMGTLVRIVMLYAAVSGLYYIDSFATDAIGTVIAGLAMIFLNKSFIFMIWGGISAKFSRK